MGRKQTDLSGKKLGVEEIEELKRATIYVAEHFKVHVSEAMAEKFEALDTGKRRKWLKHSMRTVKNSEPSGKDFDTDFKVLYAHVFG